MILVSPAVMVWIKYYVATEAYDRTLPGRWSPLGNSTWLPDLSAKQRSALYAKEKMKAIPQEYRVDRSDKHKALELVDGLFTKDASVRDVLGTFFEEAWVP